VQLESFWPPRHAFDRFLAELYRRRNLDEPWLTRDAIRILTDLLKSDDRILEWGAGTSTAWLAARAGRVLSIEHDPSWFQRVSADLTRAGLRNSEVRLLSNQPANEPSASPYVRVVDDFREGELGLTFVDGEHRSACALAVLPRLASGGVLVLDDAHNYLDHPSPSPHSRTGQGPLDSEWAKFATAVEDWRFIWTSDGFSDTALYLKP
jgi:predicted O-methyltransferase YrrM